MERRRLSKPQLPEACKPVTGKIITSSNKGIIYENASWSLYLTNSVNENGRRAGKDPKLIAPHVLTAAGHPPRSATTCIKAYLQSINKDFDPQTDKGLKRVRELCLDCAGVVREIHACTIINCPLWAHRLGNNPHNHHKRNKSE